MSNVIDVHNQSRQFDLKLEKHWLTQCGYFRIITTVFGICVTDCWNAYKFHNNYRHKHNKIGIVDFASILAKDCLNNEFSNENPTNIALTIDVPSPQKHARDPVVGTHDEHSAVSALTSSLNSPPGSKGSNKKNLLLLKRPTSGTVLKSTS